MNSIFTRVHSFEAVSISLIKRGPGQWGNEQKRAGFSRQIPPLQLPDERDAVSEARVAQQPPCQGPEVQAPPEVPAAAAELHGPQEMEGKYTKAGKSASTGNISTTQSHSLPWCVGSLVPTGFLIVNISCEVYCYLKIKCFVLQKDIASVSSKFGFNFHSFWWVFRSLERYIFFLQVQRLQMLLYIKCSFSLYFFHW